MFGTLGGPELFLIFVVALIVFGPRKLPEIGKSLGKMMAEFRKASNDFRSTIESEVEAEKIREAMRIEPQRTDPAPAPVAPAYGSTEATTPAQPAPAAEGAAAGTPSAAPPDHAAPATTTEHAEPAADAPAVQERVPDTVSRQANPIPIEPK